MRKNHTAVRVAGLLFGYRNLEVGGAVVLGIDRIEPAHEVCLILLAGIIADRNRTDRDVDRHDIADIHLPGVRAVGIDGIGRCRIPALNPAELNAVAFRPGFDIFLGAAGEIHCVDLRTSGIYHLNAVALDNFGAGGRIEGNDIAIGHIRIQRNRIVNRNVIFIAPLLRLGFRPAGHVRHGNRNACLFGIAADADHNGITAKCFSVCDIRTEKLSHRHIRIKVIFDAHMLEVFVDEPSLYFIKRHARKVDQGDLGIRIDAVGDINRKLLIADFLSGRNGLGDDLALSDRFAVRIVVEHLTAVNIVVVDP